MILLQHIPVLIPEYLELPVQLMMPRIKHRRLKRQCRKRYCEVYRGKPEADFRTCKITNKRVSFQRWRGWKLDLEEGWYLEP